MQLVGLLLNCEYLKYPKLLTEVLVKTYDPYIIESLAFSLLGNGSLVNKTQYFLYTFWNLSSLMIYY